MLLLLAATALGAEPADGDPGSVMIGHFQQATQIMLAVATNDTRDSRDLAKDLARVKGVPANLEDAAKAVSRERKPEKAAEAVGLLARTCAECHVASGRGPRPTGMEAVPGTSARERHVYAALFTWIGLVTPLPSAWDLGLQEALPPVDLDSGEELQAALQTFRTRAENSLAATSLQRRAESFGPLIEACASCHAAARVGE